MEQESKEQYAPGVESYEGRVPIWLIIVYAVLLAWGIYYLVAYWGGAASGG